MELPKPGICFYSNAVNVPLLQGLKEKHCSHENGAGFRGPLLARAPAPTRPRSARCLALRLKGGGLLDLASAVPIAPDDKWALWAVISVAAWVGIKSEDTSVGKALSGAVVSMLVGACLTLVGLLPAGPSPPIASLQSLVVALATPLLLLGADLTVILRRTGSMLGAFVCGAIGTTLGAVLGFWLVAGSYLCTKSAHLTDECMSD